MNRKEWEKQVFNSPLQPVTKLVALAYGTFSSWDRDNDQVWPSKTAVSDMTGLDRKTVQKHVDILITKGYLRPLEALEKNVQKFKMCTVSCGGDTQLDTQSVGETVPSVGESGEAVVEEFPTNIEEPSKNIEEDEPTPAPKVAGAESSSLEPKKDPGKLSFREATAKTDAESLKAEKYLETLIKRRFLSSRQAEEARHLYHDTDYRPESRGDERAAWAVLDAGSAEGKHRKDEEW